MADLVLVRPMPRILCLAALAIASCAGPTEVTGPYASRLSPADVRAIEVLVKHDWDNPGPSVRISAVRPSYAIVDTHRHYAEGAGEDESFSVTKRQGGWTRDQKCRVVIQ